jgi:hypothetical protein
MLGFDYDEIHDVSLGDFFVDSGVHLNALRVLN